jgi:hypothetical protein
MIKKLLLCFTIGILYSNIIFAQVPIDVINIQTTGKANQCSAGFGPPVVTCKYLSGNGSTVIGGALAATDLCDSTILEIAITNLRWNKGPDDNWIHGVFFPNPTAGLTFLSSSLAPTNWFYGTGCTGICPTGGAFPGGAGWYFRGPGQSCCPGGGATANPCDNYGDPTFQCNTPFFVTYQVKLCNSKIIGAPFNVIIYLTSDGNTGCWSQPDVTFNSLSFQFPTVAAPLPLFSPNPTAGPRTKTCLPTLNYTATLSGGCGNGSTITWWSASTGGTQLGSGSPFVYDPPGSACPQGTVYAACCPVTSTCVTRKAVAIPGICAAALAVDSVYRTNPTCPTNLASIDSVHVFNAAGALSYNLMPSNITNTTGVFPGLTGTSYTVTVTDALGCTASYLLGFTYPSCGGPTTTPISYCLNQPAVPLTATLTGAGTNLLWYTTLTGGVGSSTAPTPLTNAVGPTTYYVTQSVAGVESTPRTPLVVTVVALPAAPLITSVAANCTSAGTSTISNYVATNTYTFTPAGPTVGATGLITGMTIGTSYTVTTNNGTCTSLASASFSNAAMLVTPAVPTITSVAPTCLTAGTSTISNYVATNTYTFTPTGPTVSATGLINGMTVGTSYTVTSGNATCTSLSSSSFSNSAMLVTPVVPTITAVAPTCTVAGTSTISNYNAANTYTFSPTGPTVGATGLISGMTIGTSYTVTAGLGTCISAASASFSNAAILTTPAIPTITSVAATCIADGTSTISNYNAANTFWNDTWYKLYRYFGQCNLYIFGFHFI